MFWVVCRYIHEDHFSDRLEVGIEGKIVALRHQEGPRAGLRNLATRGSIVQELLLRHDRDFWADFCCVAEQNRPVK